MSENMHGNPYINHMETVPSTNAEAQLDAALALAFEQRTANLIALAQLEASVVDATDHFGDDEFAMIAARLGLK